MYEKGDHGVAFLLKYSRYWTFLAVRAPGMPPFRTRRAKNAP